MIIKDVEISDAPRLLEIYAPYVIHTAVSFEYEVPDLKEFEKRIEKTKEHYPYLAAWERDRIVGYCYAEVFHARKAYEKCVEISIYVCTDHKKQGIGRALYGALEAHLKEQGIKNLYACIAYPNKEDEYLTRDSVYFHEKMGFRKCGYFTKCGNKFNRWYDMIYMEKIIG